ncbi:eukaryotic translation initiation factor 3 subunit 8 N-terminus-domain-containing protein [Catenaria anguillulae PL171]|uniref:Eukaryotic translation initiation factor 3 subunit 8 N-terminus-domain-containing protein n=1 Tax=Catenaria anguillulae PL171 TaxID=765915 RepID=A0A1Y2HP31_9FUNG|nr:eukaryotic translation initiation factor 3 subunit 8 N-terminus-domain-containing protein [Catenaria anguillulae PL171]
MSFRKPTPARPAPASDSGSSSDDDSSAARPSGFFSKAAKPAKITKSKWFASRIRDASSSEDDSDASTSTEDDDDTSSDEATSSDDDSDSSSDDEQVVDDKAKPAHRFLKTPASSASAKQAAESSSSDSDDSYFDDSDDSDSDSDDSDDDRPIDPAQRRLRWLKDEYLSGDAAPAKRTGPTPKPSAAVPTTKTKGRNLEATVESDDEADGLVAGAQRKAAGATADGKPEKDAADQLLGDANAQNVLEKLTEVSLARGKKSTDRETIATALTRLFDIAPLPFQKVKILMALASCHFDSISSTSGAYMPPAQWKLAALRLASILDLLAAHPALVLREDLDADDDDAAAAAIKEHGPSAAPTNIKGSLVGMLERLDEELTKSLVAMDVGTPEFLERLREEVTVYTLLLRTEAYARRVNDQDATARAVLRRLEHTYNKPGQLVRTLHKFVVSTHLNGDDFGLALDVHALASYLYAHGADRLRTRAVLCHVTHHAVHDKFHAARDMLLMSGLQDAIKTADVATQALYNRALVFIGLCAFRAGLMKEAHNALHELLAPGNQVARELVNHGSVQPVNLELVEAVYLTASMMLEVPYMAANPHDAGKRRLWAKTFRRNFEIMDRNAFQGPPENTRDHIMACAKLMMQGEWSKAAEYLTSVRVWVYVGGHSVDKVKDMLVVKVKETALVAWVHQLAVAGTAESMSLAQLAATFDVPLNRVHSLLAQLIVGGDLAGKLDGVHGALVLASSSSTASVSGGAVPAAAAGRSANKVQWLTNQLAEKLMAIADGNDKILATRSAAEHYGQHGPSHRGGDHRGGRGGRGGNRGGDRQQRGGGRGGRGGRGGGRGGNRGGNRQQGGDRREDGGDNKNRKYNKNKAASNEA